DAAIARVRSAIEEQRAAHEELLDVRTGSRRTASALSRTTQFLSLAAVLGVILCGAAIGIAADRQSRRLYDTVALLRTFGLTRQQVARVLALQIGLLALLAGVVGTALGLLAQQVLAMLLAELLPANLPPPGISVWLTGLAAAAITLPAFALPPLLRLGDVSPLRVLRRDLDPPARRTLLQYAAGLSLLALLVVLVAADRLLAMAMLGATLTLIACTLPLAIGLLRLLRRLRPRLPFPLRLAADRLAHTPLRFGAQLVAFALILATMALSTLLRDDLLATWQRQLPADAPNVFALNLLPHERDDFLGALAAQGIAEPPLYPVTPGRLTQINGEPVATRVPPGSDAERTIDRDLVLTQSSTLGSDNLVTAGDWWPADAPAGLVSVEEDLAERLDVKTGDTLTFVIAGETVSARITSLRKLDWDSFRPNFFMIFSPGTLADAPYTWLTSFRAEDSRQTVRALRSSFPSLTMIEVGPLLERMNALVGHMADGIGFVLVLLLAAALLLLAASVIASLDERLGESALLRVLGARRALLRTSLAGEFALLGATAGLLAALATEAARWALYSRVMDLDWQPLPALWLMLPPLSALLLAVTGYLAARRSLSADAGTVLKEG
ncbi:MAG: ABC transporter permease, partial [Gammaproteobacteria bacterium]